VRLSRLPPSIIISLDKSAHLVAGNAGIRGGAIAIANCAVLEIWGWKGLMTKGSVRLLATSSRFAVRRELCQERDAGNKEARNPVSCRANMARWLNQREEIPASACTRTRSALRYSCGSAAATRTLALSVERLLRETSQFRWSSLRYCTLGKNEELRLG
jgi:hypothetical protein